MTKQVKCGKCGPLSPDQYKVYGSRWSCIACARERKSRYAAARVDRVRSFKDAWYERNRRQILEDRALERKERPEVVKAKRKKHYSSRQEHIKKRVKDYKAAVKLSVFTYYSGKAIPQCEHCEQTDLGCLTLDHVNEDGGKHRKELGRGGGNWIYLWVIKNKYPPRFQILCMNCNILKHLVHTKAPSLNSVRLKQEVLSHYSPGKTVCARCGADDIRILTLDHMNGDGAAHRRSLNIRSFYGWIKKNGYPDGYQVLCFSCNLKKH